MIKYHSATDKIIDDSDVIGAEHVRGSMVGCLYVQLPWFTLGTSIFNILNIKTNIYYSHEVQCTTHREQSVLVFQRPLGERCIWDCFR